MLDIPERIKELFRANNVRADTRKVVKLRFYDEKIKLLFPDENLFPSDDLFPVGQEPFLVIDNSQVSQESLVVTESLCENQNITFGECNASQVEIIVADVSLDVTNKEFMLTVEVGDYELALGIYRVESFVRQADRRLRKITAYDRMRYFDVDVAGWYQGLRFPMNLKTFRDSLCAHIGIEQVDMVLPLDDMQVTKTIDPAKLSGLDVLKAICEINGRFGQMEKTGRLKYIFLGMSGLFPSEDLFPADDLFPAEMENAEVLSYYKQSDTNYEDYIVYGIDSVQVRQEEGDIGAAYGSGNNGYSIEGNLLVYGKSSNELLRIAATVYDEISRRVYRPAKITGPALPWVELGDGIICHTTDDIIETYCLKRTLRGIQGMTDTYEAAGNQLQGESFGIVSQIIQIEGKAAIIKKSVEEVSVRVTDLKEFTEAQFAITADQILAEVTRATEAEAKLSASIRINADQILAEVKRAQESEAELSLKADQISLSVTNLEDSTASRFEQTAQQISLKVSRGEVSSQLSIEPNDIIIKSDRLSWEATNCRMDKQGNFWCNNGIFAGKVTSKEGEIGPFSITNSGLKAMNSSVQIDFGGFYVSGDEAYIGSVRLDNNGIDVGVLSGSGHAGTWDSDGVIKSTEIYVADSWWKGWSLTKTIQTLWNKVYYGGGGCTNDGCDDWCDDEGCNDDTLIDDIGGC